MIGEKMPMTQLELFYSLLSSLPLKCYHFHHHLCFHFLWFRRKYRRLLTRISEQQRSISHLFLDSGRPSTELSIPSFALLKNGPQSQPFSQQHPYAPEQGDLLSKEVARQLFAWPKTNKDNNNYFKQKKEIDYTV